MLESRAPPPHLRVHPLITLPVNNRTTVQIPFGANIDRYGVRRYAELVILSSGIAFESMHTQTSRLITAPPHMSPPNSQLTAFAVLNVVGIGFTIFSEGVALQMMGQVLCGLGAGTSWVGCMKFVGSRFPTLDYAILTSIAISCGVFGRLLAQAWWVQMK
jgi:hypothetical protein